MKKRILAYGRLNDEQLTQLARESSQRSRVEVRMLPPLYFPRLQPYPNGTA